MNWTPDLWICVPVQRRECPASAQNSKARSFVGVNRIGKAFASFSTNLGSTINMLKCDWCIGCLGFFSNYSVKF